MWINLFQQPDVPGLLKWQVPLRCGCQRWANLPSLMTLIASLRCDVQEPWRGGRDQYEASERNMQEVWVARAWPEARPVLTAPRKSAAADADAAVAVGCGWPAHASAPTTSYSPPSFLCTPQSTFQAYKSSPLASQDIRYTASSTLWSNVSQWVAMLATSKTSWFDGASTRELGQCRWPCGNATWPLRTFVAQHWPSLMCRKNRSEGQPSLISLPASTNPLLHIGVGLNWPKLAHSVEEAYHLP